MNNRIENEIELQLVEIEPEKDKLEEVKNKILQKCDVILLKIENKRKKTGTS